MEEDYWDYDACDQILPDLYISGYSPPDDLDRLKDLGITHIVNLSSYDNNFYGQFTYLRIVLDDFPDSEIFPHLANAVEFIDSGRKQGKVLVHCNAGMSRSGSVIIAYLVKTQNMSVDEALQYARKQRPKNTVQPNEGSMKQLYQYEKSIKESRD